MSVPGVVVNWIPEPAANVSVSVALSATIFDWPLTAIFLNASETVPPPPPDTVAKLNVPEPSVCNTCPEVPSDVGNVYAPFTFTVPVVWIPVDVVASFAELS